MVVFVLPLSKEDLLQDLIGLCSGGCALMPRYLSFVARDFKVLMYLKLRHVDSPADTTWFLHRYPPTGKGH